MPSKVKSLSVVEEDVRIQDFLDMIAPSIVKFNTDHFVCGNTYRCVWALREYPTTTDEQAILRYLGEKDGVTLHLYTRHVTPMEEKKIISNAANKNRMQRSSTQDLQQTVTAESNLQDVTTLVTQMHRSKEPLLHTAVYIELSAHSLEQLNLLDSRVGERWHCAHEGCGLTKRFTDAYLMDRITALLNLVAEDPTQLKIPSDDAGYVSLEVIRLGNEISRELEKTECDEELVKALILARSAAQYAACSDETQRQTAQELRTVFSGHARLEKFEPKLFEQAVESVLIQTDGTVSLKLRNGQVLHGSEERSGSICRQQNA